MRDGIYHFNYKGGTPPRWFSESADMRKRWTEVEDEGGEKKW